METSDNLAKHHPHAFHTIPRAHSAPHALTNVQHSNTFVQPKATPSKKARIHFTRPLARTAPQVQHSNTFMKLKATPPSHQCPQNPILKYFYINIQKLPSESAPLLSIHHPP